MSALDSRANKVFHWKRQKAIEVQHALNSDPVDIDTLRRHAVSQGGLMHSLVREKAWPKLVGVNVYDIGPYKGPPLSSHKDRAQVLLDVNRCTRRIPKSYTDDQRKAVQEQLTRVILRLLSENSDLHYYQGLHDIVITFLLVVGEEIAFAIMNMLVKYHIRDFLDPNLNRTKIIIAYIRPLLTLENAQLEEFITSSECAYYFSLSWLITWYGHVVMAPEEAYRLADMFLASHPLMPVYLAAAIILTRSSEVLSVECEMSAVHGLLSHIPATLSYEQMIVLACRLFEKHPPSRLAKLARLKLSANSLISTYPKFQRLTCHQRPNHILAHLPKKSTSWWQSILTLGFVLRLLSIAGPVLLAMVVYWAQSYFRTNYSAIASGR